MAIPAATPGFHNISFLFKPATCLLGILLMTASLAMKRIIFIIYQTERSENFNNVAVLPHHLKWGLTVCLIQLGLMNYFLICLHLAAYSMAHPSWLYAMKQKRHHLRSISSFVLLDSQYQECNTDL